MGKVTPEQMIEEICTHLEAEGWSKLTDHRVHPVMVNEDAGRTYRYMFHPDDNEVEYQTKNGEGWDHTYSMSLTSMYSVSAAYNENPAKFKGLVT